MQQYWNISFELHLVAWDICCRNKEGGGYGNLKVNFVQSSPFSQMELEIGRQRGGGVESVISYNYCLSEEGWPEKSWLCSVEVSKSRKGHDPAIL